MVLNLISTYNCLFLNFPVPAFSLLWLVWLAGTFANEDRGKKLWVLQLFPCSRYPGLLFLSGEGLFSVGFLLPPTYVWKLFLLLLMCLATFSSLKALASLSWSKSVYWRRLLVFFFISMRTDFIGGKKKLLKHKT